MITEQALDEAIAECQGERNPNANTCVKLAAYYQLKDKMFADTQRFTPGSGYSYAASDTEPTYQSDTEFFQVISGKDINLIFPIFDELMDTLKILQPRLYDGVMRKLKNA